MWALVLLACSIKTHSVADSVAPVSDDPPQITAITWSCDIDAASWAFDVSTARWTGGGRVWLSQGGDPTEYHSAPSVRAAADGSTDALSLDLDVVADWRYASSGSSTRFRCDQEALLSFMVTVYTADGSEVADCRTWGASPEIWATIDGAHPCETALEIPADTADR